MKLRLNGRHDCQTKLRYLDAKIATCLYRYQYLSKHLKSLSFSKIELVNIVFCRICDIKLFYFRTAKRLILYFSVQHNTMRFQRIRDAFLNSECLPYHAKYSANPGNLQSFETLEHFLIAVQLALHWAAPGPGEVSNL